MSHNAVKIIVHREGFVSKFIARTEQHKADVAKDKRVCLALRRTSIFLTVLAARMIAPWFIVHD